MLYQLEQRQVEVRGRYFVAANATVIGSVILEDQASIWFNAVVRGDNDPIHIGVRSNIQDGSVLHTDAGIPLTLGYDVTVGHKVMLHGCQIGNNCLIGINAVILNQAVIGDNCLIGANTLIPEGKIIPPGVLVMGSPGKIVRDLRPEELARITASAAHYADNALRYQQSLRVQSEL